MVQKKQRKGNSMGNIIWAEDMEKLLSTNRRGIYKRVNRGTLPRPMKICGRSCWRRQDWEKWLEQEAQRQGAAISDAEPHPPRRRGRPTKEEVAARAVERGKK